MSALTYDVEINYLEKGNIGGKLGSIHGHLLNVNRAFSMMGDGLGGAIDAVKSLSGYIANMASVGAAAMAGFAAATVKFNTEIESTQIALAAIFKANGETSTFTQGMASASDQILKMRKDAAKLPGEFSDLTNIFKTIAPNTFRAGLGAEATRQMSSQTMALAAIMQIPMNVAAREMAGLIEGRAGAHNIMGLRMMGLAGDRARDFNSKTESERIKILRSEMDKYKDALDAYSHSFDGLFSTAKDNIKQFVQLSGARFFERVKDALEKFNDWFASHQDEVSRFAEKIENGLVSAFDAASDAFTEWFPKIKNFASQLYDELKDAFEKLKPYAQVVFGWLGKEAENGNLVKDIKTAAGMFVGAKVGMAMLPAAGRAVGGALSSVAAGEEGAVGLAVAPEVILGLAAAAAAASGELMALADVTSKNHDAAVKAATAWDMATTKLSAETGGISLKSEWEKLGINLTDGASAVASFASNVISWAKFIDSYGKNPKLYMYADKTYDGWHQTFRDLKDIETAQTYSPMTMHRMNATDDGKGGKTKVPEVPNHGNTHIAKVEIVIQTNQDPNRIARAAVDEMLKVAKSPKGAPRAPNFLAAR